MLASERSGGGPMAVPWYRSLYGRVAVGYAVLLPLLLAAQAAAVVILANQREQTHGIERLERAQVAKHLALLVSQRLEHAPNASLPDLAAGLQPSSRLFVIMKSGAVLQNRGPDPASLDTFVSGLRHLGESEPFPSAWTESDYGASPILLHGHVAGLVGVTPRSMFERYGGTIVALGTGLLFAGNLALALLVVRPIRARLRNLHAAAAQLRDGDLSARATARGSDELSEVARVFNEMATQLTRRTSDFETSDRLRRQLVADVSHELMTPLTSVLARLETLGMDEIALTREQRAAQVASATNEARRLERLINDLLASVRLESGATELRLEDVSIPELFADVVSRHEANIRSRSIVLTQDVDVRVSRLVADRFRLDQAIDNLLVNALRHTANGGRIALTAEKIDAGVRFIVWDSAGTISPEHLPHIFDRFYKVESTSGIASPGSGLGLSIVKTIVARHAGTVRATSSPADGTAFILELPNLTRDSVPRGAPA